MQDLVQMLTMMPRVREMILLNSRGALHRTPPSPNARLSLPRIRKFALHSETAPDHGRLYHFEQAAWFLSAANLPPDTIYSISGRSLAGRVRERSVDDTRTTAFKVTLPLPPNYEVSRILIRANDGYSEPAFPTTFIGSSSSGSHVRFCDDYDFDGTGAYHGRYSSPPPSELADAFANSITIPPQDGLELWILALPRRLDRHNAPGSEPHWVAEIFPQSITLVVLCSARWHAGTFFRTMLPRTDEPDDIPFPLLRTLRLHLDFPPRDTVPAELPSILAERQTNGHSLDKIIIEYSLPTRDYGVDMRIVRQQQSYLKVWAAELRERLVCDVEVHEVEGPLAMPLPDSCNTDCSNYWPPWTSEEAPATRVPRYRSYYDGPHDTREPGSRSRSVITLTESEESDHDQQVSTGLCRCL
ncbi:hypothetical protein C8Q76DRAFT_408617 [Earliella scabrosa]|nr:hypothetical protein C8Q76DRAFT_408617 [Earliella scabrosa]